MFQYTAAPHPVYRRVGPEQWSSDIGQRQSRGRKVRPLEQRGGAVENLLTEVTQFDRSSSQRKLSRQPCMAASGLEQHVAGRGQIDDSSGDRAVDRPDDFFTIRVEGRPLGG